MDVHVTDQLGTFDLAVTPFLEQDPVRNTVLLTALNALRAGGHPDEPPWFAWATDEGVPVGAALRTPPYKVALSGMSAEAVRALGHQLASSNLPGAFGDLLTVAAFAEAAGRAHRVVSHEIQYVQSAVVAPPPTRGQPRAYTDADADLYVRWDVAFAAEAGVMRSADPVAALETRMRAGGGLWLWEVDGTPVAMCGRTPSVAGVPRIGPVWTPPEHRRHGYAAAITAHVCQLAFADGARACTLFADAANPTSNGIYERIGFRPVAETVEAEFA